MYRDSRRLRLLFTLLILTSFTLITVDYRAGEGTVLRGLRSGASAVFGPVQRAVTSVVRPIGNALSSLGEIGGLREENEQLEREIAELREQVNTSADERRRLAELEANLQLASRAQWRIVAARVVGVGTGTYESMVTIDVGSRSGVKKGMTVANGDGLVGRILEVQASTAQVLLANDATFEVGIQIGETGEIGTVRGDGRRPLVLTLPDPAAEAEKGQGVVTGSAGTFVSGVPVGVISDVQRRPGSVTLGGLVEPFVRFAAVDNVMVIVAQTQQLPRGALLPSRQPTPTPTPSPTPGAAASPVTVTPTPSRSG